MPACGDHTRTVIVVAVAALSVPRVAEKLTVLLACATPFASHVTATVVGVFAYGRRRRGVLGAPPRRREIAEAELARFLRGSWIDLVAALALAMAAITFVFALKATSIANANFLASITPLISMVLALFILGERLTWASVAAIGLAWSGIGPVDRLTWWLEVAPVIVAAAPPWRAA